MSQDYIDPLGAMKIKDRTGGEMTRDQEAILALTAENERLRGLVDEYTAKYGATLADWMHLREVLRLCLPSLQRDGRPHVWHMASIALGDIAAVIESILDKGASLLDKADAVLSKNTQPREQAVQPDSWLAREARQLGLGAPDQPSVLAWCAKCQARHELGGDCACQHTAYTPVSGGWKCLFCGHFRNTPNFVNADPTPAPQPPVRRPVELDDIVAHALGCRHWFAEPCSCGAADPTPSPQPSGVLAAHCIEAACRDALRYRWLRHEDCTIEYDSYWRETLNSKSPPTALDDAIDVMMNADPTTGAT